MEEFVSEIKVVFLGASNVGKTSIVTKDSTIGATYNKHTLVHDEKRISFTNLGQERFQSLVPMYYRGAHVALIVYDITNTDSYKRAKIWVKEIEEKGMTNVIIIFIGNKRDLEGTRTVEIDKSEKYCLKKKITYLETSSKTGYNIKELFQIVGEKLSQATFNDLEKPKMDFERQTYKSDFETTNKNKGCC